MNQGFFRLISVLGILLILFSGCIELNDETRLQCIQLSSFYSNSVPYCETPDKCLELTKEKFAPKKGFLSGAVSWEYDKYSLHLSKQWFYFSKARKNLKEIYNSCVNGTDLSSVLQNSNELGTNLNELFKEIDESTKSSLKIISLLEIELKEQDINLAGSSKLFGSYSKLMVNVNQAMHPELNYSSDSYYSAYLSRMKEFNEFFSANNFSPASMQSIFLSDLLKDFLPLFSKAIPIKNFLVPFFGDQIFSFMNYFLSQSALNESVSAMRGLNAQKAIEAVEGFMAPENSSVAGKFVSLISEINESKKELIEDIELKRKNASEKLSESEGLLYSENFDYLNEFNEKIMKELGNYSNAAESETVIESGENSGYSFSEFRSRKIEEMAFIKNKLNELMLEKSRGELTLGNEFRKINELNDSAEKLLKEIDFFLNEEKQSVYFLCESKTNAVEKSIEGISGESLGIELLSALSELKYFIASFKAKQSIDEKLALCPRIVSAWEKFSDGLDNEEMFAANALDEFNECRNEVNALVKNEFLSDFRPSANMLSAECFNAQECLSQCKALKEGIYSAIMQEDSFIELKEKQKSLEEAIAGINAIPGTDETKAKEKELSELEEKNDEFALLLENLPLFLEKLEANALDEINSPLNEAMDFFKKALVEFIEKNAEITQSENEIPDANYMELITRISFLNPSNELNEKVFLEFPLELIEPQIAYSSEKCAIISSAEKLVLECEGIEPGTNVIEIKSKGTHARQEKAPSDENSWAKEYFDERIELEKMLESQTKKMQGKYDDEKISSWRKEAQSLLEKADDEREKGNRENALKFLAEAKAKIAQQDLAAPAAAAKKEINEKINLLKSKANESIEKAKELGLSRSITQKKNEFFETEKQLGKSIESGKSDSNELLALLEKKEKEIENTISLEVKARLGKELPKLDALQKKISALPGKLNELKKMLLSLAELDEIINYAPPTTIERIESIEKELNELNLKEMNSKINEINGLMGQGLENEALLKLNGFNEANSAKIEKINSIDKEITNATEKIIQDSLAEYNTASKKALGENALKALENARKAIEEKDYVKALAFSKTALASIAEPGSFSINSIPLAVIPFILVIAGVIAFRQWKKKQDEMPKKKRKVKGIENESIE